MTLLSEVPQFQLKMAESGVSIAVSDDNGDEWGAGFTLADEKGESGLRLWRKRIDPDGTKDGALADAVVKYRESVKRGKKARNRKREQVQQRPSSGAQRPRRKRGRGGHEFGPT